MEKICAKCRKEIDWAMAHVEAGTLSLDSPVVVRLAGYGYIGCPHYQEKKADAEFRKAFTPNRYGEYM